MVSGRVKSGDDSGATCHLSQSPNVLSELACIVLGRPWMTLALPGVWDVFSWPMSSYEFELSVDQIVMRTLPYVFVRGLEARFLPVHWKEVLVLDWNQNPP